MIYSSGLSLLYFINIFLVCHSKQACIKTFDTAYQSKALIWLINRCTVLYIYYFLRLSSNHQLFHRYSRLWNVALIVSFQSIYLITWYFYLLKTHIVYLPKSILRCWQFLWQLAIFKILGHCYIYYIFLAK